MLIPSSAYSGDAFAPRRFVRLATGGVVLMTGLVIGLGGLVAHAVASGLSLQQRTQASNFRISRAIDQLSMVGTAHADVPASCGGGGCGGGCGCGE